MTIARHTFSSMVGGTLPPTLHDPVGYGSGARRRASFIEGQAVIPSTATAGIFSQQPWPLLVFETVT
jgi:hypothetical protein